MANPCLNCGHPTNHGPRCPPCRTLNNRGRINETPTRQHRATHTWRTTAHQAVTAWRDTYGDWCPGWRRQPHPSSDLTADHWHPGDPTVLIVFCRSCNSSKADTAPTVDDAERLAVALEGQPLPRPRG